MGNHAPYKEGSFATDDEVKAWEQSRKMIVESVAEAKKHITESVKPGQMLIPSMPTAMTRINPFYPMSRREMGERPFISQTG
jgi:hypothetical protein